MAQIKTGTVQVQNGSAVVSGISVQGWDDILPGAIFAVIGIDQTYQVNAVNYAATPPTLTLATPYAGPTNVTPEGVAYCLTNDFTPYHKLPLMARGDLETAGIFSRAMQKIDAAIGFRLISSAATAASINAGTGVVTITLANHNLITDQVVTVQGGSLASVRGTHLITVTGADTFTYVVTGIAVGTVDTPPTISYRSAISLGPTYSLPGHNFKVGTALRYDATSGFVPARSTGGESNGLVVGVVSSVSGSSFTLASSGPVHGLQGLPTNLAKGTVLYVGPDAVPVNLTATQPTSGQLRIPLFVVGSNNAADGAVFGHIVNFPAGQVATMAGATETVDGAGGAVPAPPASASEKFLSNRGVWALPAVQTASVKFGSLVQTPAFTTPNWSDTGGEPSPNASVFGALKNLHSRILEVEIGRTVYKNAKFFLTPGAGSFTVPSGVTKIRVWLWGAGGPSGWIRNGGTANSATHSNWAGASGSFIRASMTVSPGLSIPLQVGDAALANAIVVNVLAASKFGVSNELSAGGGYNSSSYYGSIDGYSAGGVAVVTGLSSADYFTVNGADRVRGSSYVIQSALVQVPPNVTVYSEATPQILANQADILQDLYTTYGGSFNLQGFGFGGGISAGGVSTQGSPDDSVTPVSKRHGAVLVEW